MTSTSLLLWKWRALPHATARYPTVHFCFLTDPQALAIEQLHRLQVLCFSGRIAGGKRVDSYWVEEKRGLRLNWSQEGWTSIASQVRRAAASLTKLISDLLCCFLESGSDSHSLRCKTSSAEFMPVENIFFMSCSQFLVIEKPGACKYRNILLPCCGAVQKSST